MLAEPKETYVMDQSRPLRVVVLGQKNRFGHVLTTTIEQWGYKPVLLTSLEQVKEEMESRGGDVLLCDLDELFRRAVREKDEQSPASGLSIFEFMQRWGGEWFQGQLMIALSSRSLTRVRLEQLGAIALLQKPFDMGRLQRYLQAIQRLLQSRAMIDCARRSPEARLRLLIVEDNPQLAAILQRTLSERKTYDVLVASDGLEALELCVEWQPHCLVTDLIMPWMNGYQIMRCLSIALPQASPAFVMMSALAGREEQMQPAYLQGKSVTYIDKPFPVARLVTAIEEVCAG